MGIGERVLGLRKERGLSQEQLAEQLSVSRQAVSKWEVGESTPDVDKIVQLSELFGTTTDYLLKGDTLSDSPGQQTEGEQAAGAKPLAVAAVGLTGLGLLVTLIGWHQWQTMLAAGTGLFIQIVLITAFAVATINQPPSIEWRCLRYLTYASCALLMLPFPLYLFVKYGVGTAVFLLTYLLDWLHLGFLNQYYYPGKHMVLSFSYLLLYGLAVYFLRQNWKKIT